MGKPKIRFKGYEDDWEQRKLNEIADKVSEKNKNNEFSEPFTNSAEQGIISQKDYFDREIVNNENLDGYYIVRNDDFIYNPRISVTAPVGPINRNRLGRNGVMSPLYTVFRTHDIDNLYLEFYFKTTKWHCFMKLNGDSGARFDRFTISSTQFMKMPIPYPTLEEQRKIGKYFDSLDHLITLHQRKCEETKSLKKYMLQKMFPENGKCVPEIRFSGFSDDWEQRKLSEFVDKAVDNRGKTPPIDDNGTHPLIEVAALGGVHPDYSKVEKYLNDDSFKNNLRAYVKEGDILFTTVGSIGFVSLMDSMEEAAIAQNIVAFRAKENFVPEYLYSLFSNEENQYKAKRIVMGAVQPSIKVSQLVDVEYMLTQNVKEQQKIGEYFSNLDHLITLHQHKCDELQKLKKFMLQNMFM